MNDRENAIKDSLKILRDLWEKEYKEAGSPLSWCPDEGLRSEIERLEALLHDG